MVVITKNTCGGHPRIDGTRVEVFNIINCLANGESIEQIAEDYRLTYDEVKDSIKWCTEFLINSFE